MTYDEWIRAFCYFLIFPAFTYFGLITFNRRQFMVASTYFTLGGFFLLLFVGLVLGHYHRPIPAMLYLNTAIVVATDIAVTFRATVLMLSALMASRIEGTILQELDYD